MSIERIRVISSFFVFFTKRFHTHKKAQNVLSHAQKKHKTQISDFLTHKKTQNALSHAQNANKRLATPSKAFVRKRNVALSVLLTCLRFVSLFLLVSEFLLVSGFAFC